MRKKRENILFPWRGVHGNIANEQRLGKSMNKRCVSALLAGVAAAPGAWALDDVSPQALPAVVVIGTTPVPGSTLDADKLPANLQSLSAADLRQDGPSSLINAMSTRLSSVNINDTLADPFQPDLMYRGFEASPVLGTPEGLAVYQNGVRINEAFGDTVDWDLFPDIAINRVDIVSANPLFGLNALGGAVSLTMKNGFTSQGGDGEFSGGSFDQRQGAAEFGWNNGEFGFYGAARILNQNGWRLQSQDDIHQYYMDLSLRQGGATIDLSYTRTYNDLYGQGAAPVQSLALNATNTFTGPQNNINTLNFVTLNVDFKISDTLAVQSVLYSRDFKQWVANGDSSDYTSCTTVAAAGSLCQGDGVTPLTGSSGAAIPDISNGGSTLIGQNDFESIDAHGLGGSLQLSSTRSIFGHGNSFAVGTTFDTASTDFFSGTEVGVLNAELTVLPSGLFVNTPQGSGFPATPVSLNANNKYYGFYLTDTFDATPRLSVTASARYNIAKIELQDEIGTALNGNNRFVHFNPALGATYKFWRGMTAYASYATNNRAPTASEIECSDPLQPCLLPSNLAGDPPNLRQVIAHTTEFGVRGNSAAPWGRGTVSWNAGVFRTNSEDDIYGIASSVSTGYFQNIGSTRRQGFEAGLNYQVQALSAYLQYSYIDATFLSALLMHSPSNPLQDANGNIQVLPGDKLPLIPENRLKFGADYSVSQDWSVGGSLVWVGSSYYRGDESNQNPQLPGYRVVSLRSSYHVSKQIEIFANVRNVFDAHYSTYGVYGDPTGVGAPGIPANAPSNGPGVDNRFQSPGMPRAYFGGVRISF
jgi:iron complex outermembrane recepter protein